MIDDLWVMPANSYILLSVSCKLSRNHLQALIVSTNTDFKAMLPTSDQLCTTATLHVPITPPSMSLRALYRTSIQLAPWSLHVEALPAPEKLRCPCMWHGSLHSQQTVGSNQQRLKLLLIWICWVTGTSKFVWERWLLPFLLVNGLWWEYTGKLYCFFHPFTYY